MNAPARPPIVINAMVMLGRVALVGLLVALAACMGGRPGAGQGAPTSPSGVATAGPIESLDPASITYSCGGHAFELSLFHEPEADLRATPAGMTLAEFIETGEYSDLIPPDGWHVAGADAGSTSFVAAVPGDPPFAEAEVGFKDGEWQMVGFGQCRPILAISGLRGGEWVLAPGERVDETTTSFAVDVTEIECASGQEAGARLQPPMIAYDAYRVVIVFTLTPPLGDIFTCPSNPSTRVEVQLREPLGDRELVDGSRAPWQDARERSSGG